MLLGKNKRQLTVWTEPKKVQDDLKTRYILLWTAWILGVSLMLCGCGRKNAEPVSGALMEQNPKLETLIEDLNGKAKTVLAVLDEVAAMDRLLITKRSREEEHCIIYCLRQKSL